MAAVARDDLDDFIAARTARNPDFPALVDAHLQHRRLVRALAAQRNAKGLRQVDVAARMGVARSTVGRIETADGDPTLAALQRYAIAVGCDIKFALRPVTS